jgi:UDP-3-O-[3-hydroxymyristoyl] glucosamine N-acyltransferase
MIYFEIKDLKVFENVDAKIFNKNNFRGTTNIATLGEENEESLIFIDLNLKNKKDILTKTKANLIICDPKTFNDYNLSSKCYIVAENPKLLFVKAINNILQQNNSLNKKGIDSTAKIHKDAKIHPNTFIGAHCYIGNCEIDEGTIIYSGCNIYDNVKIGKNVVIDSGVVIGSAGFGFVRDEEGIPHQFPQLGKVIIENDVEIGANTCIDRGALGDTIIHKGVKIDNLVQIAHNVEIGEYTYIMGHSAIAGSVKIGKNCWIAPSLILNKISIGDNVTIGFGSNVLKSVRSNTTVMGNPASQIEKYINIQHKLKKI